MRTAKDGWHKVNEFSVYVEDGNVVRGVNNNTGLPVYPYKITKYGTIINQGFSLSTVRSGMNRGTIILA